MGIKAPYFPRPLDLKSKGSTMFEATAFHDYNRVMGYTIVYLSWDYSNLDSIE